MGDNMGDNVSKNGSLTEDAQELLQRLEKVKNTHTNALRKAPDNAQANEVKTAYRTLATLLQNADIKSLKEVAGNTRVEGLSDNIKQELQRREQFVKKDSFVSRRESKSLAMHFGR
ncbi:MAG: hypothetical protein ABL867_10290 [Rickettsiales bacterium]